MVIVDVGELLVVTGYFVICTGNNVPQVRMLADEIEKALKAEGLPSIGREGVEEGKWVLIDFADVVVHIMQPEQRDFYRLEKLWGEAPRVEVPSGTSDASKDSDNS